MKNTKILFVIIFLFTIPSVLLGQKIIVEDVLYVSNNIVRKSIGDSLFQYFNISEGSYYIDTKNKIEKFLKKKTINREINEIWVLYSFNYPFIDGINGGMWVKLNNKLELKEEPSFKFIPNFLFEGKPSDFINSLTVLNIAKKEFTKIGLKILQPELEFNDQFGFYTYTVTNILTQYKSHLGRDTGEIEYCIINAVTGTILKHDFGAYGLTIK